MVSEEELKILEKALKVLKGECPKLTFGFEETAQAIERLLQEYKNLKKNYINPSETRILYYDTKKGTTVAIEGFIPKSLVEKKIEEYKKLGDEFYEKFLATYKTDIELHDAGISCDAKVNVLEELLKGDE